MIIVPLTSGRKSIAVLQYILENNPQDIHAHHVVYKNARQYWIPEYKRITNHIVPYFAEKYPDKFTFTESRVDQTAMGPCGAHKVLPLIIQMASLARAYRDCTAIVWGSRRHCKFDAVARGIYKLYCSIDIPEMFPVEGWTHAALLEEIPKELHSYLWSCVRPNKIKNKYVECEECSRIYNMRKAA